MNRRKQIGSSVWLLALFATLIPDAWDGTYRVYVFSGTPISNEMLCKRLQISPRTLSAWRRRLAKFEFLDWLVKPGVGFVYIMTPQCKGLMGEEAETIVASTSIQKSTDSTSVSKNPEQKWLQ